VPATKHSERIREALGGTQSAVVLVDDLEAGPRRRERLRRRAPRDPHARRRRRGAPRAQRRRGLRRAVRPVSLGDYCAGSNHVLPTGGCACHSSGPVGADVPARRPPRGVRRAGAARGRPPRRRARAGEDLPAHGQAVSVRFPGEDLSAAASARLQLGWCVLRRVRRTSARRAGPGRAVGGDRPAHDRDRRQGARDPARAGCRPVDQDVCRTVAPADGRSAPPVTPPAPATPCPTAAGQPRPGIAVRCAASS
jgi:hypothetical protein